MVIRLPRVSRRQLLKSSFLGGAVAAFSRAAMPLDLEAANESSAIAPVVDTTAGKIRGVVNRGVLIYRGVPYGASTGGSNRFLPPRTAEAWSGVRDAFQNGHSSPQVAPAPASIGSGLRGTAAQGEDCLVLNVFTTGVRDGRKRPVMMWIHGGGYAYGSGSSLGYDGANLSRTGDVVTVCINHRLNIVGHLYLGAAGDPYADSGNNGLLDIVAALAWVRDNIEQFGGDPANVTIFGQSGGGGKVSTLLAMPAAKGLFHKAIIESGSTLKQIPRDEAERTTAKIMATLGLNPTDVAELQQMPIQRLLGAMGGGARLGPVVDGHSLPRDPFDPMAPDVSADVPVIIGTAETEGSYFAPPELLSLDEAAVRSRLHERLGPDSDRILELFKQRRPNA